jgi:hypothetical protein
MSLTKCPARFPYLTRWCSRRQLTPPHCVQEMVTGEPLRRSEVRCRFGRLFGICFTFSLTAFCYVAYLSRFISPMLSHSSMAAGVVCVTIVSFCYLGLLVSLFRTAWTHPGRVPSFFDALSMNQRAETAFVEVCRSLELPPDVVDEMRSRLRVGSTSVCLVSSLRYCEACEAYKCQTTHHCSTCGVCVFELDHHCPWVGGCVGRDNHKFFLLFLLYTIICGVFIVVSCADKVLGGQGIKDTMLFIAWIMALAFVLILTPFLISSAQTVQQNSSTIAKMQLRRGNLHQGRVLRRTRSTDSPQSLGAYAAIRVEDVDMAPPSGGVAVVIPVSLEALPPPPRGLQRIMGHHRIFPWWWLPVAPVFLDDEERWSLEVKQEVDDQIDYHMATMVQLHARRGQH